MRGKEKKLGWSVVDQIFQRCFHVLGSSTCARDVAEAFVGELAGPCNEVLCPGWVLGWFAYVEKVFDISCQHPRTIIIAKCIRIIPLKNVKHIFPQYLQLSMSRCEGGLTTSTQLSGPISHNYHKHRRRHDRNMRRTRQTYNKWKLKKKYRCKCNTVNTFLRGETTARADTKTNGGN